jgi:hypothetical protein
MEIISNLVKYFLEHVQMKKMVLGAIVYVILVIIAIIIIILLLKFLFQLFFVIPFGTEYYSVELLYTKEILLPMN